METKAKEIDVHKTILEHLTKLFKESKETLNKVFLQQTIEVMYLTKVDTLYSKELSTKFQKTYFVNCKTFILCLTVFEDTKKCETIVYQSFQLFDTASFNAVCDILTHQFKGFQENKLAKLN